MYSTGTIVQQITFPLILADDNVALLSLSAHHYDERIYTANAVLPTRILWQQLFELWPGCHQQLVYSSSEDTVGSLTSTNWS